MLKLLILQSAAFFNLFQSLIALLHLFLIHLMINNNFSWHQITVNNLNLKDSMKSRTKSTRENLTIDSKSRKISEENAKGPKKNLRKDQSQTRKYLLKTLTLLQQHLRLQKVDKKTTNANLSADVYEIVRNKIAQIPSSTSKSQLEEFSSQFIINKENHANQANRSTASLLNISSIGIKRRSNSTLDEYFKEKFGSPAKDQETIEKKLKVLKALKKSQEIVTKAGQSTELSRNQNKNSSYIFQDLNEKKTQYQEKNNNDKKIIIDKMKVKKGK